MVALSVCVCTMLNQQFCHVEVAPHGCRMERCVGDAPVR